MGNITEVKSKEEVVNWLKSFSRFGIKPGLERMEWLLEKTNHPERRGKYIHIAGTNGKGSTAAFLTNTLITAKYKVGSFTSPAMSGFNDYIKFNGQPISDENLIEIVNLLIPLVEELAKTEFGAPTEFELITMIAHLYFGKITFPDYIVWEAGLGGRFDSTNTVFPVATIITSIDFDHTEILGDSLEKIAWEKAGIIKPRVPVIIGDLPLTAKEVIFTEAKNKKAAIYQLNKRFSIEIKEVNTHGSIFNYQDMFVKLPDVNITLIGRHQIENAALALSTISLLRAYLALLITEEEIYRGFKETFWPGRLEVVSTNPLVILDGAHNRQGAEKLRDAIRELWPDKEVTLLLSILSDKDIAGYLTTILPLFKRVVVTEIKSSKRKLDPYLLKEEIMRTKSDIEVFVEPDIQAALRQGKALTKEDGLLLITGSLYLLSEIRPLFT